MKNAFLGFNISARIRQILLVSIVVAMPITTYFVIVLDSELYYYGKNDLEIHGTLPFNIVPRYLGYDRGNTGFALLDKDEMSLISKGDKYWTSDISVNEIIKYGFTKDELAALVNDSLGKKYYVVCRKNIDIHSKGEFTISVIPQNSFISNKPVKWVDIKNISTKQKELARNYFELFFIIQCFIIIYCLSRLKRK